MQAHGNSCHALGDMELVDVCFFGGAAGSHSSFRGLNVVLEFLKRSVLLVLFGGRACFTRHRERSCGNRRCRRSYCEQFAPTPTLFLRVRFVPTHMWPFLRLALRMRKPISLLG